jgi:predicted transcriptional regulator of viral defense system
LTDHAVTSNAKEPHPLWDDDGSTVATEFSVSEDKAHEMLSDLADRGLIEKLVPGKYAIMKWRERDDPVEEELAL